MVEYEKNRRSVGEEDRKGMREIFRHVATSRNIGKPDGKLVARWWKRREKIAEALDCKRVGVSVWGGGRPRQYPAEEEALLMAFLQRRVGDGFPVDGDWLKQAMLLLVTLNADQSDEEDLRKRANFQASNGWLLRFKAIYQIRSLARTNSHTSPVSDRLEAIKEFHKWFQEDVLFGDELGLRGISPEAIFYVDQVPLSLVGSSGNRTLSVSGYGYVPIKKAKGASGKRLMTSQICIAAAVEGNGPQPVRLALLL